MSSSNVKLAARMILGLSMIVLFSYAYGNANAQTVVTGNVSNGTVTEPPITSIPVTVATVNTTAGNSSSDFFNQTSNQGNEQNPVIAEELNQTELAASPQVQLQSNQTSNIENTTSSNPQLNEKLLNYTNNAILALNDDNETEIQQNLVQIQDALIKAIGKPVVIVPAPAFETDSD